MKGKGWEVIIVLFKVVTSFSFGKRGNEGFPRSHHMGNPQDIKKDEERWRYPSFLNFTTQAHPDIPARLVLRVCERRKRRM
jgi:hypothetical protein